MPREAHTIVLPEGAPQSEIIERVNTVRGEDTPLRILGLVDAWGNRCKVVVDLEPDVSLETIRNLITHCCQSSQKKNWWQW